MILIDLVLIMAKARVNPLAIYRARPNKNRTRNGDLAEIEHVVLGLIFLKYISDAFEAKHAELDAQRSEGADPEDHHVREARRYQAIKIMQLARADR